MDLSNLTEIYEKNDLKTQYSRSEHSKYNNIRVKTNDYNFDSKVEYERYLILKELEKNGEISNLRYHNKNDIIILLDDPIIKYEPDFCYDDKNGKHIVEDIKGFETEVFKLKKKMIISKIKKLELDATFIITKKNQDGFKIIFEYSKSE